MNDQSQYERPNDTLVEQLELDLPDAGDIYRTRACEGVSGVQRQMDAEPHISVIGENSSLEGDCAIDDVLPDDEMEEAYEEAYERVTNDIYRRVMGALQQALSDAGVTDSRIAFEEDLVENALGSVIDGCFDEIDVSGTVDEILESR